MHVSLRLPFVEQIVNMLVLQERIVPMDVPQVIELLMEVTMSSSQDRILEAVSPCSRAADGSTVCGCAEDRVSRQNPATDFRAVR